MRQWIISAAVVCMMTTSFALAEPTKVLVAPFTEVNEQQQPDWINRAIHQSISDELASLSEVEVVPNNPAVALPSTAQAKGAGVKYIVRATIQRLNGEIRITGRVQNVDDGKTVGGFKATGPQHQLFAIEDSIARQLKRIVSPMEGDLEAPQTIATGPARGGAGGVTPLQPPIQPIRGVYEGSDLQRSLEDRDYLRRTQRRAPTDYSPPVYYPPQPLSYPPTYPGYGGYGYGYGYGGWGWGRDTNVVIINKGDGSGNGGGSSGGGVTVPPSTPRVPIQAVQTQRIRDAAVNPGNNGNFIGPPPARAPHPGTINK